MIRTLLISAFALSLSAASPVTAVTRWDFEQETPTLEQGWTAVTDQVAAGASYLMVRAEKDGSNSVLHLKGDVVAVTTGPGAGVMAPFAGAIHFFSATPFRAADLSGATTLSFRIKGRRQTAEVALFQEASGVTPSTRAIPVTPEWTEYRLPLAGFGVDTARLTGLAIGRSTLGNLDVVVDDIQIQ